MAVVQQNIFTHAQLFNKTSHLLHCDQSAHWVKKYFGNTRTYYMIYKPFLLASIGFLYFLLDIEVL